MHILPASIIYASCIENPASINPKFLLYHADIREAIIKWNTADNKYLLGIHW